MRLRGTSGFSDSLGSATGPSVPSGSSPGSILLPGAGRPLSCLRGMAHIVPPYSSDYMLTDRQPASCKNLQACVRIHQKEWSCQVTLPKYSWMCE